MASSKRSSSSAGSTGRRRRAPTIELTASEIDTGAKAAPEVPESVAAAALAETRPAAEMPHRARETERPSAAATGGPQPDAASAPLDPPPAAGADVRWLPFPLSKSHLVAGLAGGVAVLVVIAVLWVAGLIGRRADDTNALTARLAVLELQVRDLNDRITVGTVDPKVIDNVMGRLTSLETTVAKQKVPAADPALTRRIAVAENAANTAARSVKSLTDTVAKFDRRLDDAVAIARAARNRADTAATAGDRADAAAAAIAELKQSIEHIRTGAVARSDVDRFAGRIAELEKAAKTVRAAPKEPPSVVSSDRAVRLAVAAWALKAAVEHGEPFATELAAVKSLSNDASVLTPLAPFAATGLPDDATLARELSEHLPAVRRVAGSAADEGGFLQRLQANAEKLVRIRPINEVTGDDASAVVTRIESRAGHADINGALAELAKLPAAARAPAEAWIAKAKARQAAEALSRRFTAEAISALGKTSP